MGAAGGTQRTLAGMRRRSRGSAVSIGKDFVLAREGELFVVFLLSVHGKLPLYHFRTNDTVGRNLAMVDLARHHGQPVTAVAKAFGLHRVTLHTLIERFENKGSEGLIPGKGRRNASKIRDAVARRLLELKSQGVTDAEAARRLGVTSMGVAHALRRLGWKAPSSAGTQLRLESAETEAPRVAESEMSQVQESGQENQQVDAVPTSASSEEVSTVSPAQAIATGSAESPAPEAKVCLGSGTAVLPSADRDPLNRQGDRLLARLGLLDDAPPLFADGLKLPQAGVLLAIPALVASGVFEIADRVYGSLGPAFFGLRTSVLVFVLMALLRIKRAEELKEVVPRNLGRFLGLDRAPELKTARRKLQELAGRTKGLEFLRSLAHAQTKDKLDCLGFLYIDGHVRAYSGKRRLPKAYVTQRRLAMPGTTDYWVLAQDGAPVFVVTAEANEGLTTMLLPVLGEIRQLLGKDRRATVAFDRGGWSPELFKTLIDAGFDVLTYRKGKAVEFPLSAFTEHKGIVDGRKVSHMLAEQKVHLLGGKLEMRQINRLKENERQTQIITNRTDLTALVLAYRMFGRWRQENFFKYMLDEFALDALVDYGVEAADPDRSIPNPARKALDKQLQAARAVRNKLEQEYGVAAFDNPEVERPTMRGFKIANGGAIGRPLREARDRVEQLEAQRKATPARISLKDALPKDEQAVRLRTETKRLSDTFKMLAYRIESALTQLLSPHYKRADDEGRTLISTALQSAADIEVTDNELRVTLAPLSSPHRTRAIQALCSELNEAKTHFPGTKLTLRFAVHDDQV